MKRVYFLIFFGMPIHWSTSLFIVHCLSTYFVLFIYVVPVLFGAYLCIPSLGLSMNIAMYIYAYISVYPYDLSINISMST